MALRTKVIRGPSYHIACRHDVIRGPDVIVRGPEKIFRCPDRVGEAPSLRKKTIEELYRKAELAGDVSEHASVGPVPASKNMRKETTATPCPPPEPKPVTFQIWKKPQMFEAEEVPRDSPPEAKECAIDKDDAVRLRKDNSKDARQMRREISMQTRRAVRAQAYCVEGWKVQLSYVDDMLEKTRLITSNCAAMPGRSGKRAGYLSTRITKSEEVALRACTRLSQLHGDRVALVSAASAYHCGGGFVSGGRHALEEALCTQTTVYSSLDQQHRKFLEANPHAKDQGEKFPYIPADGAILSPLVEVFRTGTADGYTFMNRPLRLACVVSVAMYNMNNTMRDAPVDAPTDPEYTEGVRTKCRVALAAALETDAVALVMPDLGCGVYMNPPARVGRIFGEVVRRDFWGHFKEIVVVGSHEFQNAVQETVGRITAEEDAKLHDAQGMAGGLFDTLNEKEGWHYGFMSDVGQAAAQRSVCGHVTEQLVADASIDKSRVSPEMSPRKSGMPVWQFRVKSGWNNFDVQASQNVESQFQMYQRGELRGQGTVWSRQKHIVLDFGHMLQHVEGSEMRKRKIRRVET